MAAFRWWCAYVQEYATGRKQRLFLWLTSFIEVNNCAMYAIIVQPNHISHKSVLAARTCSDKYGILYIFYCCYLLSKCTHVYKCCALYTRHTGTNLCNTRLKVVIVRLSLYLLVNIFHVFIVFHSSIIYMLFWKSIVSSFSWIVVLQVEVHYRAVLLLLTGTQKQGIRHMAQQPNENDILR